MSELVLSPTLVTTEGVGTSHNPYVVASDPVTAWSDGNDATYAKSDAGRHARGNYPKWSDVDPTIDPTWVTAIGVRFRAMTPSSDVVDHFVVQLFGQTAKLLSNPFHGLELPLRFEFPDAWIDFDYVVADADYDEAGWAPDGVQSALEQTFLYCRTVPTNPTGELTSSGVIFTAEQSIVIYYTRPGEGGGDGDEATVYGPIVRRGLSPLRQYPRSDGRGANPVRRAYPPPPSVQASNRRGPSAIL